MPTRAPLSVGNGNRKRKVHRKSRAGCGNCKLRRVKCDEERPCCKRCLSYGVSCNYDANSDDLQFAGTSSFSIMKIDPPSAPSLNQTVLGMVNAQLASHPDKAPPGFSVYKLRQSDMELLARFQKRTALTIGVESGTNLFANEVVDLAFGRPFLMHIILTLALRHDRFLDPTDASVSPTAAESFHWYTGTSIFNKVLSLPVRPDDRDALWAAAALLGTLAFSCLETKTPEAAWPLRAPAETDLEWLRMSEGKKAVFALADPARPDSIFHKYMCVPRELVKPLEVLGPELASLPTAFLRIFGLHEFHDEPNPYLGPVSILAQLMNIECNHRTILKFLSFISNVEPGFKKLLLLKDAKALLVLAYWYGKCCQYHQWWIWRRAMLEGQAVCMYLERYYSHETELIKHLDFPKMMCGLFR